MPNWCENTLTITGNKELKKMDIARFFSVARDGDTLISFNKLFPLPKELEGTEKVSPSIPNQDLIDKYGADNWYDWCIKNWGTKWEPDSIHYVTLRNKVIIQFRTAWSPPVKLFEKVSMKFSGLKFRLEYGEYMMGFRGTIVFKNGKVIYHKHEDNIDFFDNDEEEPVFADDYN